MAGMTEQEFRSRLETIRAKHTAGYDFITDDLGEPPYDASLSREYMEELLADIESTCEQTGRRIAEHGPDYVRMQVNLMRMLDALGLRNRQS